MLTLALSLLLVAEPATAAPPELKIAAPGLVLTGMDAALSAPLTEQLAKAFDPIRVITPRDIAALLGLERQKELLGCGNSDCMAELGNALGVQGVLIGDIVKLGDAIQINARVIDPVAGRQLATASSRVNAESELFDALTHVGLALRAQFYAASGAVAPMPLVIDSTPNRGTRRFFLAPGVVSAVSLAGSLACFIVYQDAYHQLTAGEQFSLQPPQADSLASRGGLFEVLSGALLTVGIVALVTAVAFLVFGSKGDAT